MPLRTAAIVSHRFGLGPRPGELLTIARDWRGWLLDQLGPHPEPVALASMETASARATRLLKLRGQGAKALEEGLKREARESFMSDVRARTAAAVASNLPLRERLVHFWSNHFTVSTGRVALVGLAGPFEVEAIRPYVTGRFRDMLIAVAQHPAMLIYLDNAVSFGPRSQVGQLTKRGLNENLAREILELHTLGVDGGYTQEDVRQLALILTGWTVGRVQDPNPGSYRFVEPAHEPGEKRLLGHVYKPAGEAEGIAALTALASHPSTARHLATKFARHFISDEPSEDVVETLMRSYLASGGDLAVMTKALIEHPAATAEPRAKVKTPNELVLAVLRGLGAEKIEDPAILSLKYLDQFPFTAPSPAGWSDKAEAWLTPEALMRRMDWSLAVAEKVGGFADPSDFIETSLGPLATEELRLLAARAPSRKDALGLVLASPEFQRR